MQSGILIRSLALAALLCTGSAVHAQFDFGGFDNLGGGVSGNEVSISTEFLAAPAGNVGELRVTADIAPGWHIYSVTQPKGATIPTDIKIDSDDAQLAGALTPDSQPKIKNSPDYKVPLEEHYGRVTWTAPIQFAEGVDPKSVSLPIVVTGQVCDEKNTCIPKFGRNALKATAAFAGELSEPVDIATDDPPPEAPPEVAPPTPSASVDELVGEEFMAATSAAPFSAPDWNARFYGEISPSVVAPGGVAKLSVTAVPLNDNHLYQWGPEKREEFTSTLMAVDLPPGWKTTDPVPSTEPIVKKAKLDILPDVIYHEGPVTWTVEIHVPETATVASEALLEGVFGFQTCTDATCDPPNGLIFQAPLTIAETAGDQSAPLGFAMIGGDDSYDFAAENVASIRSKSEFVAAASKSLDLNSLAVQDDTQNYGLAAVIGIALLGGLVLNVMPCVLPVIGLKVMSFVQQAGESRSKIIALNLWYVLGMMSVFWALATLAVVWNVGWGAQFSNETFQIVMVSVVFAMALSLLGVWEVPIPGFAGSGKAAEAAEKEGALGALLKGILTTILATPCLAPGMGTALGWCNGKSAPIVFLVFSALGLGMGLPYIVIGLFPKLISYLPKPGQWMDTFKQLMSFLLLGTVVYFFTFMAWEMIVPTIAFLFGLWAGLWWIGLTPVYSDIHTKIRSWAYGASFAALIGIISYSWLADVSAARFESTITREIGQRMAGSERLAAKPVSHSAELDWQPYSEAKLTQLATENRTVMIDFTADWCPNCKVLEATVLNTKPVKDAVEANGVETLVADWTDYDDEITVMLDRLGSAGIPVVAIFPAGRPNEPIVLKDGYTQSTLIKKLNEAGASKTKVPADKVAQAEADSRGA